MRCAFAADVDEKVDLGVRCWHAYYCREKSTKRTSIRHHSDTRPCRLASRVHARHRRMTDRHTVLTGSDCTVCVCVAGVDSSVHLIQCPPSSYTTSTSSSSSVVIGRPVDDVYHGTRAALSAGNTTVGQ